VSGNGVELDMVLQRGWEDCAHGNGSWAALGGFGEAGGFEGSCVGGVVGLRFTRDRWE